ncbi:hypothetical protein EIN_382350 [Entamoeba invadens IP1]|uniref:Uncharacterized protein n=1 Tax=Entamoeba invadens IP1 TaxID=370355 RepID=A0A0A1U0X5_ENTIV|nr:hypothetical protein EIN_382350 [Entamoeba invadens IP1]ELP87681.1 hypothetical protein EIN_382350 [Entamoeba invadens IP1]|eukprot:XP_004254452.1 hypothetical protein EIN_382350 [Entamoeba invadens IP1]
MAIKLEIVFLMKVALNFFSRQTLYSFIQVSKVCLSALCSLKVNPVFMTESSVIWFYKHFTPETIDFGYYEFTSTDLFTLPKQLYNVDFTCAFKNGLWTTEFVRKIFPKVVRLSLLFPNPDDDEYILTLECIKFITHHTKYLTALKYLYIDFESFIDFIADYTENKKEKYLNLPETIVINMSGGKPIELNTVFIDKLNLLEQTLLDNEKSTVYITISHHPKDKEVLKLFKKTTYYYATCVSNMCETLSDRILCDKGSVCIEGFVATSIINKIIENTYSTSVVYIHTNKIMKTTWVLPKSVSQLTLLSKNEEEAKINLKTQVLNINFSCIKTLNILSLVKVKFDNQFPCLKSLSITNAVKIIFTEKCEMAALVEIELWNVNDTYFSCNLDNLKTLFIYQGNRLTFSKKLNSLKTITVVESNNVSLPKIDFNNKVVHLSNSKAIIFNGINSSIYLRKYSDKTYIETSIEKIFEFPIQIKEKGQWKMSKFVSMSPRVEVVGNKIKRKKEVEKDMYDMVVSYGFLNGNNCKCEMQFIDKNDVIKTIANVRYFEIELTRNSYIAVGIMNVFEHIVYQNVMLGWQQMSCGYHSDDETIYNNGDLDGYDSKIRSGKKTGETDVVGVGIVFNIKKMASKFFFTCNGNYVVSREFNANSVATAISMNVFSKIVINYGEKPFEFDLNTLTNKVVV